MRCGCGGNWVSEQGLGPQELQLMGEVVVDEEVSWTQ